MAKTPAATAAEVTSATPATQAKLPAKATKVWIREPEIKVDANKTNPAKTVADPTMRQLFTSALVSASSWNYFASPPSNSLKVCIGSSLETGTSVSVRRLDASTDS
jgi:hypothetical protein